ncbi:DUF6090 family protein [Winogradskyella maritima]|uniref:DUF6090 family protein n=1 Tax=Winogradskyella maritima TaxID=1517766 RepID=A0ABV8AH24_9FLAO|nr:DUF6090 family protein [Winogradskyella maritima]
MIKFFRKIRYNLMEQNKTGKYFKYAIGEIILVVIGILIALQINNWNENRKSLINERVVLTKFLQDLESDSTFFQFNNYRLKDINQLHTDLYKIGLKDAKNITLKEPNYIRRNLRYNPIARENNPDITSKLNDKTLRERVQNYYRQMSDTDESNSEFDAVVLKIREFLRKRKGHNLSAWFESKMSLGENIETVPDIISSESLELLSKDEDFQQLLFESSIKLNELRVFINVLTKDNSALMETIRTYIND